MGKVSERFEKYLFSFLIIAVITSVSLFLPFFSNFFPEMLNKMKIENAVADVSEFDISDGEVVYLAGNWDFYWMKRLVTDNIPDTVPPDAYISVPNSWTNVKLRNSDENLKNGGYASYKITLTGVPSGLPVMITVPNFMGTYNVFIDGVFVCRNEYDYKQAYAPFSGNGISANPVYLNYSEDGTYEVVVEVECNYSGGLTSIPQLASFSKTQNEIVTHSSYRYFYIGIVAFFCLITLFFGFFMKDKVQVFWLCVLCFTVLLRLLFSNDGYLVIGSLFPQLDYEIISAGVYVSTYIIKLSMFMHVTKTLEIKVPASVTVAFSAVFLGCAVFPYFFYGDIYIARVFLILQSVAGLIDVYAIVKLVECLLHKQRYSVLYLIGYCTVVCATVTDNFAFIGNIAMRVGFVFPLSFLIYITLTYVISILGTVEAYDKAKQNAELSKELAEINNTLMLSQIQPHFLYNTLNTIKYLVKKDSKTAETVIVKFASYLRANMDSLTQREPIPFEKELEHVKNYAEIEKIRFGQRLNVEYNIACTDFKVPPLTLQPIVENAIKHGVNQKPEGGTVNICTYSDNAYYYIEITDDGVGFDITKIPEDGRTHIGISNITERLKTMLNAAVSVNSIPDEGTNVLIRIPRNAEERKE